MAVLTIRGWNESSGLIICFGRSSSRLWWRAKPADHLTVDHIMASQTIYVLHTLIYYAKWSGLADLSRKKQL